MIEETKTDAALEAEIDPGDHVLEEGVPDRETDVAGQGQETGEGGMKLKCQNQIFNIIKSVIYSGSDGKCQIIFSDLWVIFYLPIYCI